MSDKPAAVYLRPDGVGESPLPDYPGTITFPLVMTLAMHKRWQAFVNGRAERDPNEPRVGVVFVDDGAEGDRIPFVYDDIELALLFCKLELTGPDGKKITEKVALDNLPVHVSAWMAKCYREWETSQMFFRWNGTPRMVAQDSA